MSTKKERGEPTSQGKVTGFVTTENPKRGNDRSLHAAKEIE